MGRSMEWMNILRGVLQISSPVAFVNERSDRIFILSHGGDKGSPQVEFDFAQPRAYFEM